MIKKLVFFVAKKMFKWALAYFWSYLDKDSDGKLSKREINAFIKDLKRLKDLL